MGAGGGGSDAGGVVFGGLVLEAPVEDFGWVVRGVEFPLPADLGEDVERVLTGAFRPGEGGCQGGPGGIGEDGGGVVGDGGAQDGGVAHGGLGAGGA